MLVRSIRMFTAATIKGRRRALTSRARLGDSSRQEERPDGSLPKTV
jgi:hypothetical protein